MLSRFCATSIVAAHLFFAASSIAANDAPTITGALREELHKWIDTATDLPRASSPAKIVFAQPRNIVAPSELATLIGRAPRGLYDTAKGEITLILPWSARNPQDVSVLLHELVHHRQSGRHFYCEAAKEHSAYKLQRDWLAERGLTLDVNWIAVVLSSSCVPRDIHP